MNVFVLCTGRCGSLTLANACKHINNFSTSHESRCSELGDSRLEFPDNHIEIDNRLAWFIGRIEKKYGDNAVYVHLKRNPELVAASYNQRWSYRSGLAPAYAKILQTRKYGIDITRDLTRTINENIEFFLKDKSSKVTIDIERPIEGFLKLWGIINAEGSLASALKEFGTKYNLTSNNEVQDNIIQQFESRLDKLTFERNILRRELNKLTETKK